MGEKTFFVNREKIKLGNWKKENKGLIRLGFQERFSPDLGIETPNRDVENLREILQRIEKIEAKVKSLKEG